MTAKEYQNRVDRYELQAEAKQIWWLRENNKVVYDSDFFLGIRNCKYKGVYTFFVKRNKIYYKYALNYNELADKREIEEKYECSGRINEDENKSIKRFHFHLDNPAF